eukprot:TRINITY_DN4259_c0_g2_i1.p1 TRINITY_DN4259_c0_g2~~TRINITY_DN4259_c0_g2_i1.p1  ORF type:complete len:297 (-),score=46.94 TRINITY_DN4259_c0_g2_i1:166-1056(-)
MGVLTNILGLHFDMDKEYQGWILIFASMTAIWLFCLPCYCAGMSSSSARKFASWTSQRLPVFYVCITLVNGAWLFLIIQLLPDYTFGSYLRIVAKCMAWMAGHVLKWAASLVMIIAFSIAVAFKDRIALLLGVDHKQIFNCKARDCLSCCGASRFQAIEILIWKVEDLPSAGLFSANNVFVEMYLGYNETMHTRVHNNAGSDCIIKERAHFNFDDDDLDEKLVLFVRNQQVVGAQELARKYISANELRQMISKARGSPEQRVAWNSESFGEPIQLMPRGRMWLKVMPVEVEELPTC